MSDVIDITSMNSWIDSRDLIRRREDLVWSIGMGYEMTPDEDREFEVLEQFIKHGETITEWESGTTVVADVGWEDYAREEVQQLLTTDQVKMLNDFPFNHLDWKGIVDDLQSDYKDFTVVTSGMPYTFWVRA